jgi:hypothetical protein
MRKTIVWKWKLAWQKLRLAWWTAVKWLIRLRAVAWLVRTAGRFWRWFTFAPKPPARQLYKDERGILYQRMPGGPLKRLGPETRIRRADGEVKRVVYQENRPRDKHESRKKNKGHEYVTKDGRVVPARMRPVEKSEEKPE